MGRLYLAALLISELRRSLAVPHSTQLIRLNSPWPGIYPSCALSASAFAAFSCNSSDANARRFW